MTRAAWPVVVPSDQTTCGPIHVDEECAALREATSTRRATRPELRQLDVCKICVGGWRSEVTQDKGYQRALRRAANDD